MRNLFVFLVCISLTNQLLSSTSSSPDDALFAGKDFATKGEFVCNEDELRFIDGFRQGLVTGCLARIRRMVKEEKDWEFLKKTFKDNVPEQRVSTILNIQQSKLSEEVKEFTIKRLDDFYLYKNLILKKLASLDIEASFKENQQDSHK